MNTVPGESKHALAPRSIPGAVRGGRRLLDAIVEVHGQVGDGLNDQDLTCLLQASGLPTEAGFAFLSFSNHSATLSVPPQDPADWYPPQGRVAPEKERLATAIAAKYQLALYEPPDQNIGCFPRLDEPPVHRHLEFTNEVGTVVVVHPQYMRIRLFAALPGAQNLPSNPLFPLHLGPSLLQDLSVLYQSRAVCAITEPIQCLQPGEWRQPCPGAGNVGEPCRVSDALREEWTHKFEQPLKPSAGRPADRSRSPSRQVPRNHA